MTTQQANKTNFVTNIGIKLFSSYEKKLSSAKDELKIDWLKPRDPKKGKKREYIVLRRFRTF